MFDILIQLNLNNYYDILVTLYIIHINLLIILMNIIILLYNDQLLKILTYH